MTALEQSQTGQEPSYLNRKYEAYVLDLFKKVAINTNLLKRKSDLLPYVGRLASIGGGSINNINPGQRLALALEANRSGDAKAVAKKRNVAFSSVLRSIRDVTASMIYVSGYEEEFGPEIRNRVKALEVMEEALSEAAVSRNHPEVIVLLKKVPHVQILLDAFLLYGTAKFELDANSVINYTSYQLRSIGKFLREFEVDKALDGLTTLSQRYIFGRWLSSKSDYGDRSPDRAIAEAAAFVFNNITPDDLSGRQFDSVRDMRLFLVEMMRQEFDYASINKWTEMKRFFLSQKGKPAKSKEDLDIALSYSAFAEANFCPLGLRRYAGLVRDGIQKSERIKSIRPGEVYSQEWLASLDWAGLKFLENALIVASDQRKMNSEIFIQNTGDVLKTIKQRIS